jgi:CubicO group peptidase (beta-lactamase class C family)
MAVAVVAAGDIAYVKGFGHLSTDHAAPVGPDTPFYIASTTKSMTAFAIQRLAQRGVVDLRQSVSRLVPSLRFHPQLDTSKVTLETLLAHTHGMDGDGPLTFKTAYSGDYNDRAELLALIAQHGPAKNGTAFDYSNVGPIVAGLVVESVTGKTWKQIVEEEVIGPLGLQHTTAYWSRVPQTVLAKGHTYTIDGFAPEPMQKSDKTMHAAGGHYSTARDLAVWLGVHINKGMWKGQRVFDAELIRSSLLSRATQDRKTGPVHRDGWALGWDLGTLAGERIAMRPGGFPGYASHISFMPEKGVGVVVLANGGGLAAPLIDYVVATAYAQRLESPQREADSAKGLARLQTIPQQARQQLAKSQAARVARQVPLPLTLQSYAGRYTGPLGDMVWSVTDGRLSVSMGQIATQAEVFDAAQHAVRVELTGSGQVVTFEAVGDTVSGLTYGNQFYRKVL